MANIQVLVPTSRSRQPLADWCNVKQFTKYNVELSLKPTVRVIHLPLTFSNSAETFRVCSTH